jgi:protein pelota
MAALQVSRESATGGTTGTERVTVRLGVKVEAIEFDADSATIRVKGKVCSENKYVKMGAYHTLDLGAASALHGSNAFEIEKECWDAAVLARLKVAADVTSGADVIAVALAPSEAQVCLVTQHMTVVRAKLEPHIPKARGDGSARRKAVQAFFGTLTDAMLSALPRDRFDEVKAIVIAGPGFLKNDFVEFVNAKAVADGNKQLLACRSKIVLADASGGHKRALEDAMSDPVSLSHDVLDACAQYVCVPLRPWSLFWPTPRLRQRSSSWLSSTRCCVMTKTAPCTAQG